MRAATLRMPDTSHAPRSLTILGATGSIGQNALKLLRQTPGRFAIAALTAQENLDALIAAAREFTPRMAVIGNPQHYAALKEALAPLDITVAAGEAALSEAAALPSDITLSSIVGAAGLKPTLAALRRGGTVALANKECLVCAGELIRSETVKHRATLLPVDSEHSAIFQVFDFEHPERIEKITLTASGGPFRTRSRAQLTDVTAEEAVRHPNWSMGAKISVDSATLMNKGLELIEAYHLFPMREDQIEIVIHPESVVHGLVHHVDGSVLAQMSPPDMCTPIAVALAWPERLACQAPRLDLAKIGKLTFEAVDTARFPAITLTRSALKDGGCMPAILNAANETAVAAFLSGKLAFTAIEQIVGDTMAKVPNAPCDTLDSILAKDSEARHAAADLIAKG